MGQYISLNSSIFFLQADCTDPMQYIKSTPSNSFHFPLVTQVFTLFGGLKENKASLDVIFTETYNESGEVPEIFKYQRLPQYLKMVTVFNIGNYRPIAFISSFSKMQERLSYAQLVSYLGNECLLFNIQFGFRKGYSTGYAILETLENLKSAIHDGTLKK